MLKPQNLLRTTNPENFSSVEQIVLKISFLKDRLWQAIDFSVIALCFSLLAWIN